MTSAEEVAQKITELSDLDFSVTGFHIAAGANGEANELVVIFNPRTEATTVTLPEGEWDVCVSGQTAGVESIAKASGTVTVEPISATILTRLPAEVEVPAESEPAVTEPAEPATEPEEFPVGGYIAIGAAVLAAAIAVIVALKKKNKK